MVAEPGAADVEAAVRDHAEGASVALRVVPRARRTQLAGRHGSSLKLKVSTPPVGGAANREVSRHLARLVGVRPSEVVLVQGDRSREKLVVVRGRSAAQVRTALGRALGEAPGAGPAG